MEKDNKLIHIKTPGNFKYPEIKDTDFIFGSGEVVGTEICSDGDWRNSTPPEEYQSRHGVESSACFIEAQQHTIATIQEKQHGVLDQNYSSRFNLNFADATEEGGSPLKGADSIRKNGLIPDEMMPFSDDIESWAEFRSFKNVDKADCLIAGQRWLNHWDPKYDIVFLKNDPVEIKYRKLKQALKYSPICASVYAWILNPETNEYEKPEGYYDQHLIEIVYVDNQNSAYIWDTYAPFLKKLAPNYNFDFGLRWTVNKVERIPSNSNWVKDLSQRLFDFFKSFLWK